MFIIPNTFFSSVGSGSLLWSGWDGLVDGTNQNAPSDNGHVQPWNTIVALDSSRFLLIYLNDATTLRAVIGTVGGTSVSYGLTNNVDTGISSNMISSALLAVDKVIVCYTKAASNHIYAAIITTSSGTPVINMSQTDITMALATLATPQAIAVISPSSVFMGYVSSSNSNALILSISGNTITSGTPTTIEVGSEMNCAYYDTNKIVVTYKKALDGYSYARIINISGTSIGTIGAEAALESAATTGNSSSGRIVAIDSATALAVYQTDSPANIKGVILSLSGNTVTVNAPVSIVNSSGVEADQLILLNSTEAMLTYDAASTSTYARIIDWTGPTISVGSEVTIQTSDLNAGGFQPGNITMMDSNTVCNAAITSHIATTKVLKRN